MDYRLQFVGLQSNPEVSIWKSQPGAVEFWRPPVFCLLQGMRLWVVWWFLMEGCLLWQMEMGSLAERSNHELEDESLISPAKIGQKTNSFHAPQLGSSCRDWRIWSSKLLGNAVFMSIRVVVFSSKLNLLMPFGPLAVLVHGLSDHNVSFICLYTVSCIYLLYMEWIEWFFADLLWWFTGLGLLSNLVRDNTIGWAFRLCYRVRSNSISPILSLCIIQVGLLIWPNHYFHTGSCLSILGIQVNVLLYLNFDKLYLAFSFLFSKVPLLDVIAW